METQLDQYIDLIKNHARVAYSKIRKPTNYSVDDLTQEGIVVFLMVKKEYSSNKNASFKTYLTLRLRQHLDTIVKKSYWYKKKEEDLRDFLETQINKNCIDPLDILYVSSLLNQLTVEETNYIKKILELLPSGRKQTIRKEVRKRMEISYFGETKLRNSIRDKMRK